MAISIMRIAYIILAHKDFQQLYRLVLRLNDSHASFIICVDKKTDEAEYLKVVASLSRLKNIHFIKNRPKVHHYYFSMVQATIQCIEELFQKNVSFAYAFLLSGQHYPIKTNQEIINFLQKNQGKEFINYFPLPSDVHWQDQRGGLDRIERWHFLLISKWWHIYPGKLVRRVSANLRSRFMVMPRLVGKFLFKRTFPAGFQPYGGSQWWCLSRECLEFILEFVRNNKKFVDFFRYTLVPDEMFFQAIILNSHYKSKLVNDCLVHTKWTVEKRSHPMVMTKLDFATLSKSQKLFARKFDTDEDVEILDMIDRNLLKTDNASSPNSG